MFGLQFNIILAVFNMLPIPGLDGGNVLAGILPRKLADAFNMLAPFGLFIVLGLVAANLLGPILQPPLRTMINLYTDVFGLWRNR